MSTEQLRIMVGERQDGGKRFTGERVQFADMLDAREVADDPRRRGFAAVDAGGGMSEVRILPNQDERVESGPTQFGDDWPGVFIRGDNALWYALFLRACIKENTIHPAGFIAPNLEHLARLMEGCDVRKLAGKGTA